jgi:predicted kinase
MRILYICRGLPGSGKSTRAKALLADLLRQGHTAVICSSDEYFVCPCCKAYSWAADRLSHAHAWCRARCMAAMEAGVEVVIIDNTNCTARECRDYVMFADQHDYAVVFLEPTTPWAFDIDELARRNIHGVSRDGLERMLRRWVPDMTVEKALGTPPPGPFTKDEQAASGEKHVDVPRDFPRRLSGLGGLGDS